MKTSASLLAKLLLSFCLFGACSSAQPVKTQAYASLSDHTTLEYDFPTVWKGMAQALRELKVVDRDPPLDVDPLELRKITTGKLETDWIYTQSRDKYVEYKINGSPRKQYLQTRLRYKLKAESRIGGTDVTVHLDEEIEKLKADGTPAGYEGVGRTDSSRASEILEKIKNSILSAAP